MSSLSDLLPEDIVVQIFLRLPAKYLLKFRLVCKYWFNFISDPRFIKMHINLQAINEPPLLMISIWHTHSLRQILHCYGSGGNPLVHPQQQQHMTSSWRFRELHSSCNGLLYMTVRETSSFNCSMCLWNPCTKEFKKLPCRPRPACAFMYCDVKATYGFGYDSATEDFKVIRNSCFYGRDLNDEQFFETVLVEVYTLRSDSWKTTGNYPYEFEELAKGLFVNGGIYWFARKSRYIDMIICFDIANEDYIEISNPPFLPIKTEDWLSPGHVSFGYAELTVLKGFLCIINRIREQTCLEVWAMNTEWSKLFTIKEPITALPDKKFELLGNYNKNNGDEILVLVNRKELALYNPKNDKTRTLLTDLIGDLHILRKVQTCIESLVSLNSGTYASVEGTYAITDDLVWSPISEEC